MIETLDRIATAPIKSAWKWLHGSFLEIINAPSFLVKLVQAVSSLIASVFLSAAAAWFVAVKATEVVITITDKGIHIVASTVRP